MKDHSPPSRYTFAWLRVRIKGINLFTSGQPMKVEDMRRVLFHAVLLITAPFITFCQAKVPD
jgi:hypothetical protein